MEKKFIKNNLKQVNIHYVSGIYQIFSVNNIKKTRLHEHMYDLLVHFYIIDIDDILHIYKYFMIKHNIKRFFQILVLFFDEHSVIAPNCFSLSIKPNKSRFTLNDYNFSERMFFYFTANLDKYGGSFNTISDPFAKFCVLDGVKQII